MRTRGRGWRASELHAPTPSYRCPLQPTSYNAKLWSPTSSDGVCACPPGWCQVLVRGANAVGYTSYPDNTVEQFVTLAAKRGIDLFRIFDCFNDVGQMRTSINAVLKVHASPQAHSKTGRHIMPNALNGA